MLFYPAASPLSRQTLTYTAGILRRHRRRIGSAEAVVAARSGVGAID